MANTRGLTPYQVKWASQHDWFEGSVKLPMADEGCERYTVLVRGVSVTDKGRVLANTQWFDDYALLRTWAGY